jgi:hypothetical protein
MCSSMLGYGVTLLLQQQESGCMSCVLAYDSDRCLAQSSKASAACTSCTRPEEALHETLFLVFLC